MTSWPLDRGIFLEVELAIGGVDLDHVADEAIRVFLSPALQCRNGEVEVASRKGDLMNAVASRDGTTIAVDHVGDGPPIVIVVVAFNDRTPGAPVAAAMAPNFTVFTYATWAHVASSRRPNRPKCSAPRCDGS